MNDLERYVEGLLPRYETYQAMADAVGLSVSAFLRGVKVGSFNVENCLKIAETFGEDPSKVLTLAGKKDIAALIERLYGKPSQPLSSTDRRLIELSDGVKGALVELVSELAPPKRRVG